MINKSLALLVASFALGTVALGAQAQTTETFHESFTGGTVPFSDAINYHLFNTALGTLTNVSIDLTSTINGIVVVNNYSADLPQTDFTNIPGSFTNGEAQVPLTLTGPPSSTLYVSTTATALAGSGSVDLSNDPTDYPDTPSTTTSSTYDVLSSAFSNYEKAGGGLSSTTVDVTATSGIFQGTTSDYLSFGGSATVTGLVNITYTYTPAATTPEPGSVALLVASGAVSLVGLRRRRTAKK